MKLGTICRVLKKSSKNRRKYQINQQKYCVPRGKRREEWSNNVDN